MLALSLILSLPAHADLCRWVDPATGSIKFSSLPPPPKRAVPDAGDSVTALETRILVERLRAR